MKLKWIHRTIFLMCCVIFLDIVDSCILLVLGICMGMKCIHVSKSLWG